MKSAPMCYIDHATGESDHMNAHIQTEKCQHDDSPLPASGIAGLERGRPVIQPWVIDLPLRMQSTMLLSLRGPDGCGKHNTAKALLRQLRSAVLIAAFPGVPDLFMGDQRGYEEWSIAEEFLDSHDEYPHHWLMHFVHAAEIVGQFHPDDTVRAFWWRLYVGACAAFHMQNENINELSRRLADPPAALARVPAPAPVDTPGICDCGSPAVQCNSCAVADWQVAHPDCPQCCTHVPAPVERGVPPSPPWIRDGDPRVTTIIAEIATNHGGDVDLACDMVRQAAEAGADYVKTQAYSLERLHPADPQRGWLTKAHLDEAGHARIFQACKDAGVKPLSTPFDADSLALLRRLGLTEFKIASSESGNDWWVGTLAHEKWFVSWPWGAKPERFPHFTMLNVATDNLALTHLAAIPLYPTPLEAVGRATLLDGYSDHAVGLAACQWALAQGVRVLEVHMHDAKQRGRVCAWDKSPQQIRELREFADQMETIKSGVATTYRRRWTA